MRKPLVSKSKFLSLVLRHDPSAANIELDPNGWAPIPDLLAGAQRSGIDISPEELREIVETNEKRRFILCETSQRIRACQGHSLPVELDLQPSTPPTPLYHGTASRFEQAIRANGLNRMQRQHVHLSAELDTARSVGQRHGSPIVFAIDTAAMLRDGFAFYQSENGVWLVDSVPNLYFKKL